MSQCLNCSCETNNPKFCSKSCSAKYNNKIPKRKLEGKCKICESPISSKLLYCKECKLSEFLLSEYKLSELITEKNKIWFYSFLRRKARYVYNNSDKPKYCVQCGFNNFYEVCHIKSISEFPKNTKIKVINHLDNLIALCPNCHWEFDKIRASGGI